jgi:hypothetical protein
MRRLNFRLMQLRHTNDELRARLQNLLDQARRIVRATEESGDDVPPLSREHPPA